MDLAEKGDNLNLDENDEGAAEKTEHVKESSAGDVYSDWSNRERSRRPLFNWGKAVGKNLCKLLCTLPNVSEL